MLRRIYISLMVLVCATLIVVIPYYVGLYLQSSSTHYDPEIKPIVWMAGVSFLLGIFIIGCAFFLWIKWIITGEWFDSRTGGKL
jgi:hypothetical protein